MTHTLLAFALLTGGATNPDPEIADRFIESLQPLPYFDCVTTDRDAWRHYRRRELDWVQCTEAWVRDELKAGTPKLVIRLRVHFGLMRELGRDWPRLRGGIFRGD